MKNITIKTTFILSLLLVLFGGQLMAQQQSKLDIALRYVEQNLDQWHLTQADITDMVVSDQYMTKHNEVSHVYFIQRYAGIEVNNAIMGIHIRPNGEVAFATNRFFANLVEGINATNPQISALQAVELGAKEVGLPVATSLRMISQEGKSFVFEGGTISDSDIKAQLTFEPNRKTGKLSLAWRISLDATDSPDWWDLTIDALSGQLISRNNLTVYCSFSSDADHDHDAHCTEEAVAVFAPKTTVFEALTEQNMNVAGGTYHIFPVPVESPIHGAREIVVDPAILSASPYGWHDTNGSDGAEYTITRGNNVHAYLDTEDENNSAGDEPDGGAELIFDYPFDDQTQEPEAYQEAAVTQLFYMNNMMHDFTYQYGFDEESGNFQQNTYGNGGAGGDFVRAEAQDGSGTNNANFSTPQDGASGRMQMYLWNRVGGRLLSVLSPPAIVGDYETGTADFGPPIGVPIIGFLVEALDGSNSPNLGCEEIINGDEVNGKIAVIDRGGCYFEQKAVNCEAAGAIAVIICNYENSPAGMAGRPEIPNPTIPTVSLGSSDCQLLRNLIDDGVEIKLELPDTGGPVNVDADFDNGIIAHEYGHGISNRLTGGPSQAGCLGNDEQMGEGWSDFFALITSVRPGDTGDMVRGVGNYATRNGVNGSGIRSLPYSTDFSINDKTYDDVIGTDAPHPLGEVWVSTVWDLYWALVDEYGFDEDQLNGTGGNNLAIQLVMDGMKYQACNPGFIDGRDAILVADAVNNEGANECLIWEVFARRGFGVEASQGSSFDRNDGIQSFEPLPICIKELKIKKKATELIAAGEEITITLEVRNDKDETATGVIITDEMPNGTAYVGGSAAGATAEVSGNTISFDIGDMGSQTQKLITYRLSTTTDFKSTRQFYDDIESGDGNWLFNNLQGNFIWDITSDDAHSGTKSWFVPDTEEENDQELFLLSPITVSGNQPVLRFYHRYDTESGVDGGIVQISTDFGATYDNVDELIFKNGYRGQLSYQTFTVPNLFGYWGNSNGFIASYIDLSPYMGEDIIVRFRFGSDLEAVGEVEDGIGWFVDDFEMMDMFNYNSEACVTSAEGDEACSFAIERGTIVDTNVTTGTDDPELPFTSLSVFPNPAQDVINIAFDNAATAEIGIEIYSTDGRLIKQHNDRYGNGYHQIPVNVGELPAGFYFVKIRSGKGIITEKIVIE
ncbi:MAG: hypothetical protein DHS20C18_36530 [Saprospiraceae bacterium]|nr:MAG: hypothetical protein DHS20C18_36530 [Saprospiraceae bacterium]